LVNAKLNFLKKMGKGKMVKFSKYMPLLVGSLLFASTTLPMKAYAAPPDPIEIRGLQQRPDLPVASIILRRAFPDHPVAGRAGELPEFQDIGERELPRPNGGCNKNIDPAGPIGGITAITAQDNGICTSADIDNYIGENGNVYVAQAGGEDAAFVITDVTDPTNLVRHGPFTWSGRGGKNTYTPDVKHFKQTDSNGVTRDYLALSLERLTLTAYCGVVIVDVTDPTQDPIPVIAQATGADWCDVHNTFVEEDANELGQFIYLTADGPNDMRVLAIDGTSGSSVGNPVEIGRYAAPGRNNDNYVHDITVIDHGGTIGRRAYLAYWDSGTVVLDAADVTPGTSATPIVRPNELDPAGFLAHHAWASDDGLSVFIQDEFLAAEGDAPVQMWDVSDPANPSYVDGLVLGTDVPVNPAHNLEMRSDIAPDRLYVAWYKLGLRAWDFDSEGFVRPVDAPTANTAVQYHQVQTEGGDDAYDGAWGVRLDGISQDEVYIYQSDRRFGLIVDCAGMSCPDVSPPQCVPTEDPETSCSDGIDNDCDGLIDVDDANDCGTEPPPTSTCEDHLDQNSCRADKSCRWDNRNDQCTAK
jgi:hypothetical protein